MIVYRRTKRVGLQDWQDLASQARQAQADLAELMKELDRAGDRLETRVDAKMQQLRQAVAEAEKKMGQFRGVADDLSEAGGKRPLRIGPGRGGEVAELSRQGLDPVEIARRTHLNVGEVELLLSLRRSKPTAKPEEVEQE